MDGKTKTLAAKSFLILATCQTGTTRQPCGLSEQY
jgi:hypothetical protein